MDSVPFSWRSAPQPDIVRAAQKDSLYLQQSVDACHDAMMRLLGPIPALQHSKSCKVLSTWMYYALTTGAGLQTLGEEYCDILQLTKQGSHLLPSYTAAQAGSMAQSPPQQQQQQQSPTVAQASWGLPRPQTRVALVLLQSFGPAVLDRLVASLDRATEQGSLPAELSGLSTSVGDEQLSPGIPGQQAANAGQYCLQEGGSRLDGSCSNDSRSLMQQLQLYWTHMKRQLAPRWPEMKSWLLLLGRVHLAAFYLHGVYYEWSKRLLGVTYTSAAANKQQRASYKMLGLMLVVQLAISAMQQAKPQLAALHRSTSSQQIHQLAQKQHVVVLPDITPSCSSLAQQAIAVDEQQQQDIVQAVNVARLGRQCPLCLSPRSDPTCTPCGHVFCWQCIAQWCTEKPECPLCRTGVVSSQLVCLYHSDF